MKGANDNGIELSDIDDFEAIPGKGVRGVYSSKKIGLGNKRLMSDFNTNIEEKLERQAQEWQLTGQTVMFLIIDNKVEGMVSVADTIKATSAEAIKALQKMGVKVFMLTGDNEFTAKSVAEELNLDGFIADCLPE